MRVSFLVFVLLFLNGCATKYQPKGFTGGYEDFEAQPGIHYVSFRGNGYTSKTQVIKYWHKRAAEICGGKEKYQVLKGESQTDTQTSYRYQSNTNYAYGSSSSSGNITPAALAP